MGRCTDPSWNDMSSLHEAGSSFQYETSARVLDAFEQDWFFPSPPSCAMSAGSKSTAGTWRWSDGKAHQLTHQTVNGQRIPAAKFPILHCYYHQAWKPASKTGAQIRINWSTTCVTGKPDKMEDVVGYPLKMLNLSWDLNVFWSRPYWESDL
jgi:hypothetical protein